MYTFPFVFFGKKTVGGVTAFFVALDGYRLMLYFIPDKAVLTTYYQLSAIALRAEFNVGFHERVYRFIGIESYVMHVGIFPMPVQKAPMVTVAIPQEIYIRVLYCYGFPKLASVFNTPVFVGGCFVQLADIESNGIFRIVVARFLVYAFYPLAVYARNIVIAYRLGAYDNTVNFVLKKYAVAIYER